ncbi:MAG: hypothetical protein LAN71_17005 [Acidobacteriia bacterium]|nr:hypothetical protein [Terriglobia bacterium]
MTAVQVSEDIHLKMQKKKLEILEKYGRKFDIKDIADAAIISGFNRIEEELGLKVGVQNKIVDYE